MLINTIGPVWDGNEVWLLVAGGATFAAFPEWYATLFSGFYLALLLILVALIVRGVAFEYRGKRDGAAWRARLGPRDRRRLGAARAAVGRRVREHRARRADRRRRRVHRHPAHPAQPVRAARRADDARAVHAPRRGLPRAEDARRPARAGPASCSRRLSVVTAALVFGFLLWTYLNAVNRRRRRGSFPASSRLDPAPRARSPAVPRPSRPRRPGVHGDGAHDRARDRHDLPQPLPARARVLDQQGVQLTIWSTSSNHYTLVVMTIVALVLTPIVLLYQAGRTTSSATVSAGMISLRSRLRSTCSRTTARRAGLHQASSRRGKADARARDAANPHSDWVVSPMNRSTGSAILPL